MASVKLAKVSSKIKGYHVYCRRCKLGDILACNLEQENPHSRNAIKVLLVSENETIGHVPEALSKVLAPDLEKGIIIAMEAEVTGLPRDAPEGKWTLGGGIEIPCTYTLYGLKKNKQELRKKIKQAM